MIQRIQSLYLLIVAVLVAFMFFSPVAEFFISNMGYNFYLNGIRAIEQGESILLISTYPLLVLFIIILALVVITIFLYKNRKLQMRLCRLNMMLLTGSYALFAYYIYRMVVDEEAVWKISLALIIPVIAIILYFLAFRGIKKDEALIRSIDRIR